jgi:hypothetical protein
MMTDRIIATIPKNATEEIRIGLTTFNGHRLCMVRVFYDPRDGTDWRPGKSGINVRVEQIPDIIEALTQASEVANG